MTTFVSPDGCWISAQPYFQVDIKCNYILIKYLEFKDSHRSYQIPGLVIMYMKQMCMYKTVTYDIV